MLLSQAKMLGGIGSILVLLSPLILLVVFIPPLTFFADVILGISIASGIAGLSGWILMLVAIKKISDAVNDREIFKNVLMAVIIPWVAIGVVLAVGLGIVMYAGPTIAKVDGNYLAEVGYSGTDVVLPTFPTFLLLPIITLMMLLGVWAALIASGWFFKRGYELIAVRTGTKTFRTVGRLYFYCALLVIVLMGVILAFVAVILQIKAFFSLQETLPLQSRPQALSISRPLEGPEPREDGPFLVFP
jgi:uncharacterized membrane protein